MSHDLLVQMAYYSTIAWSKVYPYTCDKRKYYKAPASRGFQSICQTNATTKYLSRGRKRTSTFQREVELGTTRPAICSSEKIKLELAGIEFDKPKDKISTGEHRALKELSRNKSIILKKSDKGNTTVLMSRQDKLNEGQVLLDDLNNYRPLDKPMVETTTKKAQQLIKTLLSEGHIDKTTAKWLSLTPDPPRIPVFYTLTKIHKPTPVGRPIISGCSGPTERISAFVDHLIQPIAQLQASYLKDTTDFINFIERIKPA